MGPQERKFPECLAGAEVTDIDLAEGEILVDGERLPMSAATRSRLMYLSCTNIALNAPQPLVSAYIILPRRLPISTAYVR
jgi:hypothetical protein